MSLWLEPLLWGSECLQGGNIGQRWVATPTRNILPKPPTTTTPALLLSSILPHTLAAEDGTPDTTTGGIATSYWYNPEVPWVIPMRVPLSNTQKKVYFSASKSLSDNVTTPPPTPDPAPAHIAPATPPATLLVQPAPAADTAFDRVETPSLCTRACQARVGTQRI